MANRLAHEVLGRSLDELPPQTRRLLLLIDEHGQPPSASGRRWSGPDYRFSRRDVRAFTGWGDTQLKMHLHRLEEMEYLLVHRGGRGQSFVYELMFARPSGRRKAGAARPDRRGEALEQRLRRKEVGARGRASRGQVGPKSGGVGGGARRRIASIHAVPERASFEIDRKHIYGRTAKTVTTS